MLRWRNSGLDGKSRPSATTTSPHAERTQLRGAENRISAVCHWRSYIYV